MSFPRGMTSMPWTKGDRKARKELEKALEYDKDDHVTRFALVRLLSNKGEWEVAEVCVLHAPRPNASLHLFGAERCRLRNSSEHLFDPRNCVKHGGDIKPISRSVHFYTSFATGEWSIAPGRERHRLQHSAVEYGAVSTAGVKTRTPSSYRNINLVSSSHSQSHLFCHT